VILSLLDGLANGRDLEAIGKGVGSGDRDKPLLFKLREARKAELSPTLQKQLSRILPALFAPSYGFSLSLPPPTASTVALAPGGIVSTSALPPSAPMSAVAAASASASVLPSTAPASSVPLTLDNWRLLEDYADTPLTLASVGGVKLPRKTLTYVMRTGSVSTLSQNVGVSANTETTTKRTAAAVEQLLEDGELQPPATKLARAAS